MIQRRAYESRRLIEAPLGSVNLDLDVGTLTLTALELVRQGDRIALRYLLNDAASRGRALIGRGDSEAELGDLLDKLACLAATFLEYEEEGWFGELIGVLAQIYSMPLAEDDDLRFDYATKIDPGEIAPRVWLLVIERVFGLGALAVRRTNWKAVRTLTVQLPQRLSDYHTNWLRHALTMASRAQHLQERRDDGQILQISLLSLARNDIARLGCLRTDGLIPNADEIITSLAQFDVLSNIVAIDNATKIDRAARTSGRVFYTNFARFRQIRIQPIVERLLTDDEMRSTLFTHGDEELAVALVAIGEHARHESWMFDGFEGWGPPLSENSSKRTCHPQRGPETTLSEPPKIQLTCCPMSAHDVRLCREAVAAPFIARTHASVDGRVTVRAANVC